MLREPPVLHVAVDLGAGSGRVMVGFADRSGFLLREVHRFQYGALRRGGHLRWDFTAVIDGIREGVRRAGCAAEGLGRRLESIGVDSWAVDYGLLDSGGRLLEDPICYRDERTAGLIEKVSAAVPYDELFKRTGIQFLALNTLYQLVAHVAEGLPREAARLLLIPDLCHHALCGSLVTERTNASTTQLLRLNDGRWDDELFASLDLPRALMPEIVPAGSELGTLSLDHQHALGVGPLRVIAPATHDTGSAVAGTPLRTGWAYISSGTWSLVGVERAAPLVTSEIARSNFTNEAGLGGTTRFLKNVMGLWMLDACRREWDAAGLGTSYSTLLERAEAIRGCVGVVFPDHPRFFNPPSMTAEIRASLEETGQSAPSEPVVLVKVILDSLALRYASIISEIETLTGQAIEGIHIVGGGARNDYLNQATADATGRPVLAGPIEAAAAGNLLVQAIACRRTASLADGRSMLASYVRPKAFTPRRRHTWMEALTLYEELEAARAM
jgi:rhamnulokinase